jgi:hypothetical protein
MQNVIKKRYRHTGVSCDILQLIIIKKKNVVFASSIKEFTSLIIDLLPLFCESNAIIKRLNDKMNLSNSQGNQCKT